MSKIAAKTTDGPIYPTLEDRGAAAIVSLENASNTTLDKHEIDCHLSIPDEFEIVVGNSRYVEEDHWKPVSDIPPNQRLRLPISITTPVECVPSKTEFGIEVYYKNELVEQTSIEMVL
ncbi:hypothetical protein [Natrinema pallidum]|uniref:hypothetical protein n=1 Tax=Natrinema pallidum TaxID=69527 RepID=UPI001267D4D1|nr:hypothetical protein [Natrinema pallidum]